MICYSTGWCDVLVQYWSSPVQDVPGFCVVLLMSISETHIQISYVYPSLSIVRTNIDKHTF